MTSAIASTGLTKRFGSATVVDGLDLAVPTGSVYGFLGPNGSGKTTTIRMLLGLVLPSSGTHQLLGHDFASSGAMSLERVGALVEGPAFHPYLSGRANLARLDAADRTASARTATARIGEALDRVGLAAAARKRYRAYSLGMRQRLGIAAALLRPRDLLVLDEPTNGLDPQGTREVRALIDELSRGGTTVFLSSHLLSEIEHLCTEVGVMSVGRLVWQGSMAELRGRQRPVVRVDTGQPEAAERVLAEHDVGDLRRSDGAVHGTAGAALQPERLVAALVAAGVGVRGFRVEAPSLEEQFVGLTGEGFDVSG
ncbi:ABC transporter ATP-binding protein [Jatrophihabitans endophyticus]|nr:ABC transporter ATP-binding protein [Jatrophihabitans endophyticus]